MVDTITASREAWLATMMDEELHLQPVEAPDIFRRKGLQMVVIGLGAAAIGFATGRLFHAVS